MDKMFTVCQLHVKIYFLDDGVRLKVKRCEMKTSIKYTITEVAIDVCSGKYLLCKFNKQIKLNSLNASKSLKYR